MSKQPSAEFSLASPIAEANNHDSNRDSVGQDDVLSPHNPSDIRNAIGGAVVSTSQAPPAPPQYLLQAATSAQEQIMKRDEILRPIFGEVGDLYNGEKLYEVYLGADFVKQILRVLWRAQSFFTGECF